MDSNIYRFYNIRVLINSNKSFERDIFINVISSGWNWRFATISMFYVCLSGIYLLGVFRICDKYLSRRIIIHRISTSF